MQSLRFVVGNGRDNFIHAFQRILLYSTSTTTTTTAALNSTQFFWVFLTNKLSPFLPSSLNARRKHLIWKPGNYMRKPRVFKDVTMRVEEKLGISRDSMVFLYGIDLICELSEESLLSKCQIFKSFGWTQSEIETFMMKNVNCFKYSDERIKKRLDFMMNELQLEPAYLTSRFSLFTLSLEKRLVPRHKIILILKEKGLLNMKASFYTAIALPEPLFLKRFVLPFKEVREVYAKHSGCSLNMLSQGTAVISS